MTVHGFSHTSSPAVTCISLPATIVTDGGIDARMLWASLTTVRFATWPHAAGSRTDESLVCDMSGPSWDDVVSDPACVWITAEHDQDEAEWREWSAAHKDELKRCAHREGRLPE